MLSRLDSVLRRFSLAFACLLVASIWATPAPSVVRDRASNDDPSAPEVVPMPLDGGLVIYGDITPGDVDYFEIPVEDDHVLAVSLLELEGGTFNDAILYAVPVDGSLPPRVSDDEGRGLAPSLVIPVGAGEGGDWAVGVGGFPAGGLGGDESFSYRLVVSRGEPGFEEITDLSASPHEIQSPPSGVAVLRGQLTPGGSDDGDTYLVAVPRGRFLIATAFDSGADSFSDPVLELFSSIDDDSAAGLFAWLVAQVGLADEIWQIRVRRFNAADESRALPYDLVVATPGTPCDVTGDARVTRNDVDAIFRSRNQAASLDDLGDFDGDGTRTVLDSRACEVECRKANGNACPTLATSACGLLGPELLIPAFAAHAVARRRKDRTR